MVQALENPIKTNIIGNIAIEGVDTWPGKDPAYRYMIRVVQDATYIADTQLYVAHNICGNRPTDNLAEYLVVDPSERNQVVSNRISLWNSFEAEDVATVMDTVLTNAGAFPRDSVDTRIINDVINQTGTIIDDPSEVGGWPDLTI